MVIVTRLIKNTQFGEMVNGGFVAAGDTFTSKRWYCSMMLKEDDDGYYQSFTEEKSILLQLRPMDLLTRMVTLFPCLKKSSAMHAL